ncbi:MAG: heme-degrading domain-containing protein [Micrococcales bacterium]
MSDAELKESLAKVKQQEELLVFKSFDETDAFKLGNQIRAVAEASGQSVAIEIARGDAIIYFTAMPGTSPANGDWARRKRNLVNLLHISSYNVSLQVALGTNVPGLMGLETRDFAHHGGSFPIKVAGTGVIGSVTVSGLPQREDHKMVVEQIAKYVGISLGDSAL